MAVSRKWKERRVVYTDWVIGLAHPDGEKLLDVIPLEEIISIQDCDGIGSADADDGAGRVLLEITLTVRIVPLSATKIEFLKAWFRIETQMG